MAVAGRPVLALAGRELLLVVVLVVIAALACLLAWGGMSWTKPPVPQADDPDSTALVGRRHLAGDRPGDDPGPTP